MGHGTAWHNMYDPSRGGTGMRVHAAGRPASSPQRELPLGYLVQQLLLLVLLHRGNQPKH